MKIEQYGYVLISNDEESICCHVPSGYQKFIPISDLNNTPIKIYTTERKAISAAEKIFQWKPSLPGILNGTPYNWMYHCKVMKVKFNLCTVV